MASSLLIRCKKLTVYWVAISVVALGWTPAIGRPEQVTGNAGTADEAARYESPPPPISPAVAASLGFASLLSDTTQTLYVEEEEHRNLVKEIIVWFIGAAFVGYFVVKVFLQGDTDETPQPKQGKQLP
jgi:hypothetical protein